MPICCKCEGEYDSLLDNGICENCYRLGYASDVKPTWEESQMEFEKRRRAEDESEVASDLAQDGYDREEAESGEAVGRPYVDKVTCTLNIGLEIVVEMAADKFCKETIFEGLEMSVAAAKDCGIKILSVRNSGFGTKIH